MLEVLIHVQGVQILRIEAGQQHVHHDGEIDLLLARQVAVGVLLVFDALLDVLVIEVEAIQRKVGAVAGVVIRDDFFERFPFFVRVFAVVELLLGQVLLQLGDVAVAARRWGEDTGHVQRLEVGVFLLPAGLDLPKELVVLDGVVDAGGGQQRIEPAVIRRGVVLFQDGLDHLLLGERFAGLYGRAWVCSSPQ